MPNRKQRQRMAQARRSRNLVAVDVSGDDWMNELTRASQGKSGLRSSSRGRTSVRFEQLRLKDGVIQVDYIFTTGGATLKGTMELPYNPDDEMGQAVKEVADKAEALFLAVRRARD